MPMKEEYTCLETTDGKTFTVGQLGVTGISFLDTGVYQVYYGNDYMIVVHNPKQAKVMFDGPTSDNPDIEYFDLREGQDYARGSCPEPMCSKHDNHEGPHRLPNFIQ